MCWAALDRYLRGVAIDPETPAPEPGSALHTELRQRQVAAIAGLWPRIRDWQDQPEGSWRDRLPFPAPFQGDDLASRTRAGWRGLRRRLDAGEPVLLTILAGGGAYDRPRAVRQVLATGWSRTGSRITLTLYDPDFPGDDDIALSFALVGALDARLSGGTPVRGFFALPYDRPVGPTLRVEAFDDRSVIGLRREVRGRPSWAVGRRHIALLARSPRGGLLHFERRDGEHWEGVNVTEAEGFGASELHCDPVAFHRAGTLHVFARSYTGDLLHFRRFRSWSLANRTDHKRAGPRFRITGRPVAVPGPRMRIHVLGRDTDGGLVHYHASPLRGWQAEQVPGDPVADDPVAARSEDTLHVVGVAPDGRVVHWAREQVWTMTDTDAGPGPRVRLAGRPALHATPDRIRVFGRSRDNELVILELGDEGVWQRTVLADSLAADPAITTGPGGLHAFAPTTEGGLVHVHRRSGEWSIEDVIDSRPTLEPGAGGDAEVGAWGDDRTLRVFVQRRSRLRAFRWTPEADWEADPLTDRAGDRPVVFRDRSGGIHLGLTDGRGILVHIETGEWQEPGQSEAAAPVATVPTVERSEPRAAPPSPEPDEDEEVDPLPLLDDPEPQVYDFEMERLQPEPEPGPEPEPEPEPASEPDTGADPAAKEPEPWEPEAVLDVAAAPEPEPETSPAPEPEGEPGSREYRWEDRPPPISADQIEPMDLSSLDSWPPTKRPRKPGPGRKNGTDREAS